MSIASKILIVEDNADNRCLLREIFSEYTNTYEATNGIEALAFLQRNPDTSLVLLDLLMPIMDGFEVLAYMRLSPRLANIPVMVLTSANEPETELRALKMGATEFSSKPYQTALLRRRAANILKIPHEDSNQPTGNFANLMFDLSRSTPCGVSVHELLPNGTIHTLFFNKYCATLCGYTEKEFKAILQDAAGMEQLICPEDQPIFHQLKERLALDRQPIYHTLRFRQKDGSLRHLSLNARIYSEVAGRLIIQVLSLDPSDTTQTHNLPHPELGATAFDKLTNIYTREAFLLETRKMLNEHPGVPYILVVWDIDRFKIANDFFGTATGDNILIQTAAHLRQHLLDYGTCGRLESDFFVFCMPQEKFNAETMLQNQAALCESFGLNYNLTIHSGIYIIHDPALTVEQMCDRARMALNTIKENYMIRYAYYTENMRQQMLLEQQILNGMHRALREHEFTIYLQPIYSLTFHKSVSAEALVRWNHPELGLISPANFIPLFEKNHFVSKVDHYVWELTCQYLASRQEQQLPLLPISVNVSRENLEDPGLANYLEQLILKYRLSPSLLRLEITESAYMENPQMLISATAALHKKGFKILMDDFGSGYSSLKLLKDIPIDILKIDMQFLSDLEHSSRAAALLLGVIRIAQSLNMITIAEGVESTFQFDFLREAGCNNIQGFYYAKPLPLPNFEQFITQSMTMER